MKYIQTIRATGVKIEKFTYDLTPLTIIIGDNAAGKTALATACRIALTGKNPLAKKADINVKAELNDGTSIERSWIRKKVSVKATHKTPENWPETPAVLLDPGTYLNLSERERVRYVAGLVDLETEWTGDRVCQSIAKLEVEGTHEAKALAAAAADIDEQDRERHEEGMSVQDWVESLVEKSKEWTSAANADVQRYEKYAQASVKLDDAEAPPENVEDEIKAKRDKLGGLRVKFNESRNAAERERKAAARKAELERLIENAPDHSKEIDKLKVDLDAAEKVFMEFPADLVHRTLLASEEVNSVRTRLAHNEGSSSNCVDRLKEIHQAIDAESKVTCGCCGKSGTDCQMFARRLSDLEAQQKKLETERANLTKESAALGKQLGQLTEKWEQARQDEKRRSDHLAKLNDLRKQLASLNDAMINRSQWTRELDQINQSATESSPEDPATLENEINSLQVEVESLERAQNQYIARKAQQAQLAKSQEELEEARGKHAVMKKVRERLNDLQAEMVFDAFKQLLQTINRFASGHVATPIEYRNGEIGRFVEGDWVTHSDFSGYEKAVTYAGISAALAANAPCRLVIVDDLIISRSNKLGFLLRMLEMIDVGLIDQVLVVDTEEYPEHLRFAEASERCSIVNLEGKLV